MNYNDVYVDDVYDDEAGASAYVLFCSHTVKRERESLVRSLENTLQGGAHACTRNVSAQQN